MTSTKALQGTGDTGPSFCWQCNRQLQRAPGKGKNLFYFLLVRDRAGVDHRVHAYPCAADAIKDGSTLVRQ